MNLYDYLQNITLSKFFQLPFTIARGSGTRLGLSLSYDIVKAHGGTMKVTSTLDIETKFIITLPYNL